MYTYGHVGDTIITRDIMATILLNLPEVYWYKLKLNKYLIQLMNSLHRKMTIKDLAIAGHIESLNNFSVKFKYICQSGQLDVIKRFSHKKKIHGYWGIYDELSSCCINGTGDLIFDASSLLKTIDFIQKANIDSIDVLTKKTINVVCSVLSKNPPIMASIFSYCENIDSDCALEGACKSGNIDVVKYILNNYNDTVNYSSNNKHMYILQKGMEIACKYGYINIINYILSKGLTLEQKYIDIAILHQHHDLAIYLKEILSIEGKDMENLSIKSVIFDDVDGLTETELVQLFGNSPI